ncbi:MAG: hypothetical protein V3T83_10150 [Acidobacteriota bacterium]
MKKGFVLVLIFIMLVGATQLFGDQVKNVVSPVISSQGEPFEIFQICCSNGNKALCAGTLRECLIECREYCGDACIFEQN